MSTDQVPYSLRDLAKAVRRWWWIIGATTIGAVAIGAAVSFDQTPVYEASAEVRIRPRFEDGLFDSRVEAVNDRSIQTEIRVIEGQAVRERVTSDVGPVGRIVPVRAVSIGETDIVRLSVRHGTAESAAEFADAYANAYVDERSAESVEQLLTATTEVQAAIDDLQAEIDALSADDARRAALVGQIGSFNTTLDQLRVDARLVTGGATIIQDAEVPVDPAGSGPVRILAFSLIVGILLGAGLVVTREYFDDRIRSDEDVRAVTGHPSLVTVPIDVVRDGTLASVDGQSHSSVEVYRSLRTSVEFLALGQSITSIQVTSSLSGEGKTTTAGNLAVVLAQAGHDVVIVDADLRRSRLHEVFGTAPSPGLTDLLLGAELETAVDHVDVGDGLELSLIASGQLPSNPSEMLGSAQLHDLIERLSSVYDYVILDSAPVLPVADAVALAGTVDATVVVAHAGRLNRRQLKESLARLEQVSAPVIGIVLNQVHVPKKQVASYASYQISPAESGHARDFRPIGRAHDGGGETDVLPDESASSVISVRLPPRPLTENDPKLRTIEPGSWSSGLRRNIASVRRRWSRSTRQTLV